MKTVVINRGLPGSGKSTRAAAHRDAALLRGEKAVIVSADDFFVRDGKYCFDGRFIQAAHQECFQKFLEAIDQKFDMIVVDNTNVKRFEFKRYVLEAKKAGYSVEFDEILPGSDEQIAEWHARCVHGVPLKAMLNMAKRWQTLEE